MSLWREVMASLFAFTRRRAEPVVASRRSRSDGSEPGDGTDPGDGAGEDGVGEDEEAFFPEPVEIPITDSIDLHYFPPGDVGEIVDAYLEAAAERGLREVRIVHGRGRGVQRHRVRIHLARSPHVEAFDDAPGDRGGWGATLVKLRVD